MTIASTLNERLGPFPAWAWLLAGGVGLYIWTRRAQAATGGQASAPSGLPCEQCGTVAASMGPALQPNPNVSNGINAQPGVATYPTGSMYIPTGVPQISGGDYPTVGGYVGLRRATPYDYARFGPA